MKKNGEKGNIQKLMLRAITNCGHHPEKSQEDNMMKFGEPQHPVVFLSGPSLLG